MVVEFADAHTEYELYQMLRGIYPDTRGKHQHLFACSDKVQTFRFATPRLVMEFAERYYPKHPYLIVGLVDGWQKLEHRFGRMIHRLEEMSNYV
jgi:hypothetical protein